MMGTSVDAGRRDAERKAMESSVEFIVDSDVLEAKTLDISESGIRFETDTPLQIDLRYDMDGVMVVRAAHLVWARTTEEGNQMYGLQFVDSGARMEDS